MKTILSFCFTLVLVLAAAPAQAHGDDLVIYDDFKGSKIDPDKWESRLIEAQALDVTRRVGGGRLRLRNITYGNDTTVTDGSRNSARVRLRFPNTVAAKITEIKAKGHLRRVKLIGCADAPATNESRLRTRWGKTFFNDGSSAFPGDSTGEVFAQIQFVRLSDTNAADAPKVMRVVAAVDRCGDPNCNIDPFIFRDDTTLGTVKAKGGKGKATIGVRWEPENDRFVFQRDHKEVIYDYGPDLPVPSPVAERPPGFGGQFADVEARAQIENCDISAVSQERPMGHLKVLWDFVKVNKEALLPAATLFGAAHVGPDGPSTLVRINALTAAATPVGPIGFERCSAMDSDASGTLYATCERADGSDTHVLITIDPSTGMGTEVGPTGVEFFNGIFGGFNTFSDISFRPSDGTLFGMSFPGEGLATVDLGTGVATQVAFATFNGELGFQANDGSALAFSPSGTLFHAAGEEPTGRTCSGIPPLGGGGAPGCPDLLHIVDPATSLATIFRELSFPAAPPGTPDDRNPRPTAMDVNPVTGTLFASIKYGSGGNASEFLGTIDIDTGAVILIGPTVRGLDAIAFVNPAEAP